VTGSERFGRSMIYLQAVAVGASYVGAVLLVDLLYVHRHITDGGLSFGYAFVLVEGGVIASLLALSLVIKFVRHGRDRRWERLRPLIVETVSTHLAGEDRASELKAIGKRNPREMEEAIAELLLRVHGGARARLSELAGTLGLVALWKRRYGSYAASKRREAISRLGILEGDAARDTLVLALSDANDEVKLEASRALIRTSGKAELRAVFHTALRDSLLVRAVLTESLRPHAVLLCGEAVPEALDGDDARTVRTALEIVRAWGKALPLGHLTRLIEHADAGVRTAALAIVPQMVNPRECEPQVLRCLGDEAEPARAAAAEVAGKLRIDAAIPGLRRCLDEASAEATVAAAYALARIGEEGCRILERQVLSARNASGCAALEALEQAKSERMAAGAL
jgi:HEAT repeat protein